MTNDLKFELQWRKYLIARLEPVLKRVTAAVDKENAKREAREAHVMGVYSTPEEAHEAFGYGEISENEYRRVIGEMDAGPPITARAAAKEELQDIVIRLGRDIRSFEWEALPEAEKERIHESNEAFRSQMEERKRGRP